MEEPRYRCKECQCVVIIHDGVIHRPCEHKEAGVTAECSAVATGESTVSG